MSDRVRVLALLKYGGLYQDTDSFMLRNCDELSSYEAAAVYQTKGWTVANGFLHAKPGSTWLQLVHDAIDEAGDLPRHRQWDVTSCKLYSKLYRKHKPLLTALPWAKYTRSTWHDWDSSFFFGQLTGSQRVDDCSVAHAIASGLDYKTKTN